MLTTRQRQVLDFLRSHQREHGTAPTFTQIGAAIGISAKSGVHRIVEALEERGHIRRHHGKQQSIEVLDADPADRLTTAELVAALKRRGVGPEALA